MSHCQEKSPLQETGKYWHPKVNNLCKAQSTKRIDWTNIFFVVCSWCRICGQVDPESETSTRFPQKCSWFQKLATKEHCWKSHSQRYVAANSRALLGHRCTPVHRCSAKIERERERKKTGILFCESNCKNRATLCPPLALLFLSCCAQMSNCVQSWQLFSWRHKAVTEFRSGAKENGYSLTWVSLPEGNFSGCLLELRLQESRKKIFLFSWHWENVKAFAASLAFTTWMTFSWWIHRGFDCGWHIDVSLPCSEQKCPKREETGGRFRWKRKGIKIREYFR